MFSKTAANECADAGTGIRVNIVTPGVAKTPTWKKQEFFQELMTENGSPEGAFAAMTGDAPSHQFYSSVEVAKSSLYFASDEFSHVTGTEIVLDWGHTG